MSISSEKIAAEYAKPIILLCTGKEQSYKTRMTGMCSKLQIYNETCTSSDWYSNWISNHWGQKNHVILILSKSVCF